MKALLITDVPPSRQSSGTLLTWHLCKNFDEHSLAGYFLVSRGLENMPVEFPFEGKVEYRHQVKRYDGSFRFKLFPKKLRFISSFARELYRKYFEVRRFGKSVLDFAKEQNTDRVWIILQGQTMIWLAEYLIKKNIMPVNIQVWDSPNWWIKARGMDRFSAIMMRKSYNFCLKYSTSFASASFPMSEDYTKTYSKPSQVLIGTIPSSYIVEEPKHRDQDKFVIGFAGQIYATDTFKSLIETLDSIYWEIDGRKIEIHYWGNSEVPSKRSRIVKMGYVPQDKLTKELSACDMLYCPYWFNPGFREEAETSFPSKLVTYLAANTIVFFHGPGYSSPVKVLESNNAGICCLSSDEEVIKMSLRIVMYCPNRDEIIANAKRLLNGQLGEAYLHSSFKDFMQLRGPSERL